MSQFKISGTPLKLWLRATEYKLTNTQSYQIFINFQTTRSEKSLQTLMKGHWSQAIDYKQTPTTYKISINFILSEREVSSNIDEGALISSNRIQGYKLTPAETHQISINFQTTPSVDKLLMKGWTLRNAGIMESPSIQNKSVATKINQQLTHIQANPQCTNFYLPRND